jgi:hypothetical protein
MHEESQVQHYGRCRASFVLASHKDKDKDKDKQY